MALGLRTVRTVGRVARKVPTVLSSRELTDLDLDDIGQDNKEIKAKPIDRLRHRHRALAKALVSGKTNVECSAEIGYTTYHIKTLKKDPTFREYMNRLAEEVDKIYFDVNHKLAAVTAEASHRLLDKLEDEKEEFEVSELVGIVKMGADRTGHGPSTSTDVNVNVNIADRLKAARERARDAIAAPILDITPEPAE